MKKNNLFLMIAVALVFSIPGVIALTQLMSQTNEVVYVDSKRLFNEFQMKKEYELKLNEVQSKRKTVIDSLKTTLELRTLEIDKSDQTDEAKLEAVQKLETYYAEKAQEFNQSNQQLTQQYNDQIWDQLDRYIEQFRLDQNYPIIIGNSGSIMLYGPQAIDVTDPAIQFINKAYQEK